VEYCAPDIQAMTQSCHRRRFAGCSNRAGTARHNIPTNRTTIAINAAHGVLCHGDLEMNAACRLIIVDLVDDLKKIDKDLDWLIDAEHTNYTGDSEEHLRCARYHLCETIHLLEAAAGE
jgi:hypothetical protein